MEFSREKLLEKINELKEKLKDTKSFEAFVHNLTIDFCKVNILHGQTSYIQKYVQKVIRNFVVPKYFNNSEPNPKELKLLNSFFEFINEK